MLCTATYICICGSSKQVGSYSWFVLLHACGCAVVSSAHFLLALWSNAEYSEQWLQLTGANDTVALKYRSCSQVLDSIAMDFGLRAHLHRGFNWICFDSRPDSPASGWFISTGLIRSGSILDQSPRLQAYSLVQA